MKGNTHMSVPGTIAAAIGAVVAVVVLSVAAWQLDWFVKEKNTDRQTQVTNNSIGRQQALQSAVLRQIATVRDIDTQEQTPAVIAQRKAIVTDICENAGMLTGSLTLPASAVEFTSQECP